MDKDILTTTYPYCNSVYYLYETTIISLCLCNLPFSISISLFSKRKDMNIKIRPKADQTMLQLNTDKSMERIKIATETKAYRNLNQQ